MSDTADWAQWEKEWLEVEKTLAELQVCSVLPPLCRRQATLYCTFAHKLYLYPIFILSFYSTHAHRTHSSCHSALGQNRLRTRRTGSLWTRCILNRARYELQPNTSVPLFFPSSLLFSLQKVITSVGTAIFTRNSGWCSCVPLCVPLPTISTVWWMAACWAVARGMYIYEWTCGWSEWYGVSSPLLQISHRHRLAAFAPPFDFTLARRQLLWQWQCIILFPATSTVLRDH